jgi:hypothetical protein
LLRVLLMTKRIPKNPSILKESIVTVREHYCFIVVPAETRTEYNRARDGHSGGTAYAWPVKRTDEEWLVYSRNREAIALLTKYNEGDWAVCLVKARDGARFELRGSIRSAPSWMEALEILTR